ncbi:MAG: hypothetical protein ACTTKH_04630 [Treponema sp.]
MNKNIFLSIIICLLLASCSTIPPRGSFAGATIIGEDSDVFIFVPVQHNKSLLEKILPEHKYIKKALYKTNFLYLSLKLPNNENANKNIENDEETEEDSLQEGTLIQEDISLQEEVSLEEVLTIEGATDETISNAPIEEKNIFDLVSYDLCAVGAYPSKLIQFFLTKKNGWNRKKGNEGYTYYQKEDPEKSSFSFLSVPTKDLALFSYNSNDKDKMKKVLERVDKPRPVYFDEDFEMAIQQGNPSNDICIFVSNSHFFLSKLIGINLDLPIENLKVYITKDTSRTKEVYTYSIILKAKNLTAGFATRLLLSKLLKTQVRIDGNTIVVDKAKVSSERLVSLIQKVLFNN